MLCCRQLKTVSVSYFAFDLFPISDHVIIVVNTNTVFESIFWPVLEGLENVVFYNYALFLLFLVEVVNFPKKFSVIEIINVELVKFENQEIFGHEHIDLVVRVNFLFYDDCYLNSYVFTVNIFLYLKMDTTIRNLRFALLELELDYLPFISNDKITLLVSVLSVKAMTKRTLRLFAFSVAVVAMNDEFADEVCYVLVLFFSRDVGPHDCTLPWVVIRG